MSAAAKQYSLPLPHREAMGVDDFMITASNSEAIAWIDKWPVWPAHCLVVYGPGGCGKTHMAHVWASKTEAQILQVQNLTSQDTISLCAQNKKIAIDDAQAIAGKAAAEEVLFHLYNYTREIGGHLLLTAPNAPAQWQIQLQDLRSRLLSVPAIAITPPDDALLSGLLIKQFRDRQISIGMDVIAYLLPRITRTPAAIRDLVALMDRASLAEGRGISIALARRLLEMQSSLISAQ